MISFWDKLNCQYHTKTPLSGNITLPNNDGDLYTVLREKPTSAYTYLGLKLPFSCGTNAAFVEIKDDFHLFATAVNFITYYDCPSSTYPYGGFEDELYYIHTYILFFTVEFGIPGLSVSSLTFIRFFIAINFLFWCEIFVIIVILLSIP